MSQIVKKIKIINLIMGRMTINVTIRKENDKKNHEKMNNNFFYLFWCPSLLFLYPCPLYAHMTKLKSANSTSRKKVALSMDERNLTPKVLTHVLPKRLGRKQYESMKIYAMMFIVIF